MKKLTLTGATKRKSNRSMASDQSSVIPNREYLDQRFQTEEERWEGHSIERPSFWGVIASFLKDLIWQGRPNRLMIVFVTVVKETLAY